MESKDTTCAEDGGEFIPGHDACGHTTSLTHLSLTPCSIREMTFAHWDVGTPYPPLHPMPWVIPSVTPVASFYASTTTSLPLVDKYVCPHLTPPSPIPASPLPPTPHCLPVARTYHSPYPAPLWPFPPCLPYLAPSAWSHALSLLTQNTWFSFHTVVTLSTSQLL